VDQHIAWQESGANPDRAMSLPALFAVVRLIASIIDQLPLTVDGQPAPTWLRKPRRYGSALDQGDLVQHMVTSMALRGHSDLLVRRLSGGSWRVDALHPGSVQVTTSTHGIVGYDVYVDGVRTPRVPAWQADWVDGQQYVLHIPYLVTSDHPEGTSPIREAWQAISGYLKVEAQAADLLDSGTYSGGRLETDHDITAETAKRFREAWVENRRTGQVPVLGNGIRYVNDIISPKDAAWIESRLANAQAVASMFGMPPDMLGMTMAGGGSSLSYQNSQDNNRRLRANCLEGFTGQISDALSQLLPPGRNEAEEQRVTFDYSEWEATANADTQPEA
jgi:HK97 family phage portal protein